MIAADTADAGRHLLGRPIIMLRKIMFSSDRPALNVYRDGSSPHGPTNYVLIGSHEPDLNTRPGDLPQSRPAGADNPLRPGANVRSKVIGADTTA